MSATDRPVVAVGVVLLRGADVLLIRSAKYPAQGWTLPGGRQERGETVRETALRELKEETGLEAEILGLVDVVDYIRPPEHYTLVDFAARPTGGELRAGSDAAEAGWFAIAGLGQLGLWDETVRVILLARKLFGKPAAGAP